MVYLGPLGCEYCGVEQGRRLVDQHMDWCPYARHYHNPSMGWICPRCNRVNAPDVRECGCKPEVEWPSPDSTANRPPFEIGTSGATFEVPNGWQVY